MMDANLLPYWGIHPKMKVLKHASNLQEQYNEDYIGEPAGSLFLRDEEGTIYTDFNVNFDVENSEDIAMASYYGPYEIHLFFDKKKVLFELGDDKWQVKIDSKVIAKNIEVSELKTAIEEILL